MIKAENITKSFGDLQVLKGIDLSIEKGKIVSIVGASGAGKTTLLQILGTLSNPDSGKITINNTNLGELNDSKIAKFRNKNIGFVFQFHQLLPEFTAIENVCIPAFIANKSRKETMQKAAELLSFLNMQHRLNHKPNEMSGGENQRVAIARALINDPVTILADEPTGNLDSGNTKELYELFYMLREKFQQTFIIVTHNAEVAKTSDNVLTIVDGKIV